MFGTYEEAVRWIEGLARFGMRPGLERMRWMLDKLDDPHRRLKFIHVAGTNGKGSVCAFLEEALRRFEYDVGMFISPYTDTYRSRIRLNGEPIPEESLLSLVNRIKPLADELAATEMGPPTMFEVSTLLAILYFATEAYPDYVVWETGMGGRLDCTNVVHPVLSIITNIGLDHTDVLGDTLSSIAEEKAGIIKPGMPVVTAVEQPEALEIISEKARQTKSTLYVLGRDFTVEALRTDHPQTVRFRSPFREIPDLEISLAGEHQQRNAACALMAIEVLRQYYALIVEDEPLYEAFRETRWPGRLELVRESPRIVLDGAHNPDGAAALAKALTTVPAFRHRRLHILLAMIESKHHQGYLEHILPIADTLILTEADISRKTPAERLAGIASRMPDQSGKRPELIVEPDWKAALEKLETLTGPEDLAVVTGTLYLVSDVRSWLLHRSNSEKGW